MNALLEWLAKREKVASYVIRIDGGGWQQVPVEGFIEAEKEAGFHGPGHRLGEPATYAFTGWFTHGLGYNARRIKVEGKTVLE